MSWPRAKNSITARPQSTSVATVLEGILLIISRTVREVFGFTSLYWSIKDQNFAAVKERVQKKLAGWKEKFLSQASKEILIKAVVQAPQNALQ